MKSRLSPLAWPAFVLFMATPLLILVVRRAGNLCFYSLLLLATVAGIARARPSGNSFSSFLKRYWPLHLAMAGPLLAIFVNQCVLQEFAARTFDYPTRMAFFCVLAWTGMLLPWQTLRKLQWAFVLGAILATIKMYLITDGGKTRGYVDFMPIIELAQLTQLLGFFALLSIEFQDSHPVPKVLANTLKLLAGIGGVYAAFLSQTRGAWVGIPVFILITIVTLMRQMPDHRRLLAFILVVAGVAGLFGSSSEVKLRLQQARDNLVSYVDDGNPDTSVGIRLQLWKGSWLLFTEHPLVGVGREQFPQALGELKRRGIITETARIQPHSHDELLYNLATLGIVGGIALLALYLVPGYYFLREWRHPDNEVRAIAGMGLVLTSGYLILGLTDVMFMWGASDNFYGIIAAILFAMLLQRKRYLAAREGEKVVLSAVSI